MPRRLLPIPLAATILLCALLASPRVSGQGTRDLGPATYEEMASERRVALVIGNGAYASAPLRNAKADADRVAAALQKVGFEVTLRKDLGQIAMKGALRDFGRALEAGGVGLFYYAGHGIQYEGTNYLVPVDADLRRPDDLEVYGIEADAVLAKMEGAGNRVNIVILDACRNNPFERSGGGGLAMMDARGTFLAYASGAGRVATDEGVYAKALARHLATPGATLERVFKDVGAEVEAATDGRQSPWTGSNLRGDFYFVLPEPGAASPVEAVVVRAPDPGALSVTVRGGGEVVVDGQSKGRVAPYATLDVSGVSPGRHVVKVGKEERAAEVTPGGVARLEFAGDTGETGTSSAPAARPAAGPSRSNPAGLEWVAIPGGTFTMGSSSVEEGRDVDEGPLHDVTVRGFEMTRSEVTVGQYAKCVSAGACEAPHVSDGTCRVFQGGSWKNGTLPQSFQGAEQPVACVDWEQASAFARWAGGRLPSEAEWEYAARGGQPYVYAGSGNPDEVAWYLENSGGSTHPVCQKRPNGYGLCDMSGNVWEWVEDWYHETYTGAPTDGSAWTSGGGSYRVDRGGSWNFTARFVRVAFRNWVDPGLRRDDLGFRVAR